MEKDKLQEEMSNAGRRLYNILNFQDFMLEESGKALCAWPPKPSAVDPRGPKFADPLSAI